MSSTLAMVAIALLALGAGLAVGWTMGTRKRSNRDVVIELETRLGGR